jgi:hypothetical protein
MKLIVYSSRTWGSDGRNFVVRTVNKLPQAKSLLVLKKSLDLASVDQGFVVLSLGKYLLTKSVLFLQIWKGWYERNLDLLYPWGFWLSTFPLEVEM